MSLPDCHLDLGCGEHPRNPYRRARLAGVDIRALAATPAFDYRVANLVLQPIPWADGSFGSVSAFDFLEHVPRILMTPDGRDTVFPFVRLMDEIWRVLAPGGLFYALTPAYPHPEAFVDPTHVNIIAEGTHDYFCGDAPRAAMYGFAGRFEPLRTDWVRVGEAYSPLPDSPDNKANHRGLKGISRDLRALSRNLRGRPEAGRRAMYLRWELRAVKDRHA
ncbi:MAG: methyltransferase domain-containing protein [Proteobacteria bacterium]|nr:methyltransferase domain-containing protein [Pseudomonadota bacterium]